MPGAARRRFDVMAIYASGGALHAVKDRGAVQKLVDVVMRAVHFHHTFTA